MNALAQSANLMNLLMMASTMAGGFVPKGKDINSFYQLPIVKHANKKYVAG